ncbi:hypothetical protein LEP1GSC034_1608 [Leptospira interrogans str. 2003000735]|uniref:Uncharacterized protein n=1 Tax=Leptospira interrogans str. 2002000626 TaxID=996803 RepID=A0A829CUC1_LEPIR|nr:hypothetical protein LEP1GSC027_1265 [Leptospira interrogans str. 2002000624]EKQ39573.1 hypothetical protein LEP1GSC025_4102 [Leptospira interrogans str. 2002000621]EKQ49537.1 hypothetical protein LEP1GSC026_2400 [Leptospira interrogans str. 2002000623]EKR19703.1 hypothetical protein LEP1GSC019_4728 [Leptospira interrogans serovar Pyrogenes str. 2006006960]EMF74090.1 hypothetical protein LEP1GSC148_0344 [Leptospira interrogans serovar Canicola str. LT1962]EMJ53395.1 hypothetical protein LEP
MSEFIKNDILFRLFYKEKFNTVEWKEIRLGFKIIVKFEEDVLSFIK